MQCSIPESPTRAKKRTPLSLPTIGILGGGQLARMLVLNAHQMGITCWVLSPSIDDPAAQVTQNWIKGSPNSLNQLTQLFSKSTVITFESEFISTATLKKASKGFRKIQILPSLSLMETIQDRFSQKELLSQYHLPTAPYFKIENKSDILEAYDHFKGRVVFKKRMFGYDGHGTVIIKNKKQLDLFIANWLSHEPKKTVLKGSMDLSKKWIAEKWIPFRRELAFSIARNPRGQKVCLPWVQTHQVDSRCLWVKGPIPQTSVIKKLSQKICKMLDALQYVGLFSVEVFDDGTSLLINELAPRVHNSAHYSMDALSINQFELHLLAVLDQDLPTPRLRSPGFSMLNLIGGSPTTPFWSPPQHSQLHWYGKIENRPGRKMGHLTALGASANEAYKWVMRDRKTFEL